MVGVGEWSGGERAIIPSITDHNEIGFDDSDKFYCKLCVIELCMA